MTANNRRHAIVLGGSIAGLLAARVLSERFERVTIVEKDHVARDGKPRKTTPQGHHVHGLLARGLELIEGWFPNFATSLEADGASLIGVEDVRIYILGWRQPHDHPMKVLTATRPFLEWALARRVRALPNVTLLEGAEALGPLGTRNRITGVKIAEQDLSADLIIDARGRQSNLADWMKSLGAETPPHETSPLSSVYCSYLLEPSDGQSRPKALQVVKMENKLGVLIFPVEGNKVLLSLGASAGQTLPHSHSEMLQFLKEVMPVPDAWAALKDLRPLSEPHFSRFTASVRRDFDRLTSPPEGAVAIGDAVASFNPIFGQGMTVAALEAEWLGRCLDTDDPSTEGFAKAFYAGLKPIVDVAWGAPDLEAKRNNPSAQPWGIRFLLWYTWRMQAVASRSAQVSKTIALVQNMLAPPTAMFKPSTFFRVLLG